MIWPTHKSQIANELANERLTPTGMYLAPVMDTTGVIGFVVHQAPDGKREEITREIFGREGC